MLGYNSALSLRSTYVHVPFHGCVSDYLLQVLHLLLVIVKLTLNYIT